MHEIKSNRKTLGTIDFYYFYYLFFSFANTCSMTLTMFNILKNYLNYSEHVLLEISILPRKKSRTCVQK